MTWWPGSPGSGAPTACSLAMSHSRTVPSRPLVISVRSSRLIASQEIGPACPENTRVTGVQSAVEKTRAPDELESAINRPLGENRAVSTPPSRSTLRTRRLVRASESSSLVNSATATRRPSRLSCTSLGVRPVEVVPGQLREAGCRRLVAERAVGSSVVVVVEPDGEGGGSLLGAGVDGAVGPAGEQRADEAFGLAVGAWPVGPRAQVAQAERAAGERVG